MLSFTAVSFSGWFEVGAVPGSICEADAARQALATTSWRERECNKKNSCFCYRVLGGQESQTKFFLNSSKMQARFVENTSKIPLNIKIIIFDKEKIYWYEKCGESSNLKKQKE